MDEFLELGLLLQERDGRDVADAQGVFEAQMRALAQVIDEEGELLADVEEVRGGAKVNGLELVHDDKYKFHLNSSLGSPAKLKM